MEASDGVVRGNVDSLMKLVGALQEAGIELIAEGATSSQGGRGVRLYHLSASARIAHDRADACLHRAAARPRSGWRVRRAVAASAEPSSTAAVSSSASVSLLVALLSLAAAPSDVTLPLGLPWTGAHFRLDPLAAFFLAVVGLGSAGASLYALGYGRHEHEPQRVLPFYPVFLAGLNLVVIADDAFSFLFAWELMSLASWALVMSHHREPGNAHAGYVYIVMASFSGLALLLCFGLLAGATGGYAFDAMRAAHPSPGIAALALVLALIGAGSKAGVVPLHAWLPLAHPAAPSHVSALMSGVMTKVAVYGFVRIAFDLLGAPTWWSGVIVLAVGGITAVLGVLYALMEHDLKRLLAYHTVENIGIIFIGLGLALAFGANQLPAAAALGLTAALFHVFNHSVFKSLLFFGAGAVLTATGERDMDHLGGLIHRMPKTAFAFLVGCVAISALPPLNGFVSEWLTFQAILLHPDLPQWGLKLAIPADGALLALSAALAAACFVKAFGVTFLGRPRTRVAADAREVDRFSLCAMFGFAALCLLAGICPWRGDRSARTGDAGADRRAHADAARCRVAVHRAGRKRAQFIQRTAGVRVHRGVRIADRAGDPSLRLARAAPRAGLGLRLPRSAARDAIHRRQLRPADPPRVRRGGVPHA